MREGAAGQCAYGLSAWAIGRRETTPLSGNPRPPGSISLSCLISVKNFRVIFYDKSIDNENHFQ